MMSAVEWQAEAAAGSGSGGGARTVERGIVVRHRRACPARAGRACACRPGYPAMVWSARERRPVRKTFRSLRAARAWRARAQLELGAGRLDAPSRLTVGEAAGRWLAEAEAGVVRTRSGDRYKPSALRSYRQALAARILPRFGARRLSALSRALLQELVDELVAGGCAPSTVRNTVLPLRAIYRRALQRGELAANPTLGLALPAVRPRRERVARPAEAEALLAALPPDQRALWATALYAGLRRGELQALRWQNVDLEQGLIHVERSWDRRAGLIAPKSRAGRRRVPIPTALRRRLLADELRQGRPSGGWVFPGADGSRPFDSAWAATKARRAWESAALAPIGLHECRHSYAAYAIAAGINLKALSSYMGHSSITVTLDRYGHLMPGNEAEAAQMLDGYLQRQNRPRPDRFALADHSNIDRPS
jgi:integrase